ncbi:MBL fold metallo-hydrolase [Roseovarius sp.]|uniref:MBL fold metallo-hydrolase n=1 Tax=Roseovarius sp. TaxID=1486281 RepID=UPI002609294D|nr:MBL fold metallo-hydrolase [Roseovarius sp.]MDM8166798.1 MBL fold metallo-hydrolase [Roseovarius sp.]
MTITRRQVLNGLGSAALATGLSGLATRVIAAGNGREVITASDGHLVLPGDFVFDGMDEAQLAPILDRHDISREEIRQPCNVTLLRDGDRVILFDAGAGPLFMPSAGDLAVTLDGLGIAPEDVTDIVFTHGHPDHLWGVLDDFDELLFPEAAFHFGQAEWDYWSDPDTVDTIGEARAAFAVGAQRRLDAIAGKTSFFTDGDEVLPGIMAHATPGHTPGHMSFEIATGGDPVLVAGDAVTNAHVNFEQPGWPSGSDQDPDLGAETRARLLDRAAADGLRLIGFHLPGGGIGRVERTGDAFRFVEDGA